MCSLLDVQLSCLHFGCHCKKLRFRNSCYSKFKHKNGWSTAASTPSIQPQHEKNARNDSHRIDLLNSSDIDHSAITVMMIVPAQKKKNTNKQAIRIVDVRLHWFNPSARMTDRIMFKLSVPAVCFRNGFSSVHTAAAAATCAPSGALTRVQASAVYRLNRQFYFYPQNKSGRRPTSSDVTIIKPSFLHVSPHLSPLPHALHPFALANG